MHRDIKTENIMFSGKSVLSEPKLIDFGLSNKFDMKHIKYYTITISDKN